MAILAAWPLAAQVTSRSPCIGVDGASILPLVILALSCFLVTVSLLRKKLEQGGALKAAPSAFAYLSQALQAERYEGSKSIAEEADPRSLDLTDACTSQCNMPAPPGLWPCEHPVTFAIDVWGCEHSKTYTRALMLSHREIAIRIGQGPPGLTAPPELPRMTAQSLKTSTDVCTSHESPLAQKKRKEFRLRDLRTMAPPTRRQKLVVSGDHGSFNIHVNAQQYRYQVYKNQVELNSFSWGGQSQRLKQSWRQVQEIIAKTSDNSMTS
mmetsp:Transcript_52224/g.93683  ORF Transcript_52224/g.93683 Transcript_52224/m.93683 type:complete len:267 (-) Transcript_52224:157-957(-)|eukprot:CAMPEP_0197662580 /NCGR_PEP_ID=MMETSP1338-20131121/54009_1 /TAXON_ID=43686 ORGANISM="Pelagodinium beii, Strain RCC1491" /NCGR_SAMPLE_ID=MMETSP1338 /ASSEMBLY_ACC=CAM_ASM_000754 /LENGTH=266 /DNA_ID=CAMNT_0043240489 /DNA_START=61 /DNA_END=861 /DNA_ORIENTATION=-